MDNKLKIGAILRQLRKEKGLSQDALSKLIGVKVTAISRWEVNKVLPNLEMGIKLTDALEVSLDVFCGKKVNDLVIWKSWLKRLVIYPKIV